MKGVDRAVFAHGRPADGDYRSKVSEKLAKDKKAYHLTPIAIQYSTVRTKHKKAKYLAK